MGAHDFQTSATGENAREAYKKACEEAIYEHGNSSYNGTISTTSGFRMYHDIPETEDLGPLLKLIRKDLGLNQSEMGSLIGRSGGYISKHERGQNPKPLPPSEAKTILKVAANSEPYKSYRGWRSGKEKPLLYKAGFGLQDFKHVLEGRLTNGQWADIREKILTDRRFEKWKKCACIKTGDNCFTFIGWAAS